MSPHKIPHPTATSMAGAFLSSQSLPFSVASLKIVAEVIFLFVVLLAQLKGKIYDLI
jgi:hypothetical protein